MRLQRLIAASSELSRRAAEAAITAGRVTVNGKTVTLLGTTVQLGRDHVALDGRPLRPSTERHYLAFNKPSRTLVTKSDPEERATIWSLLDRWKGRLNTAGRLDYDSEGLLILSDDGDFLNQLAHPRHEIWKVYEVKVKGAPSDEQLKKLMTGVTLDDGPTLPARVTKGKKEATHMWLKIGIREGRNRQIKRMCEVIGHPVLKLKRVAIGPVRLGKLRSGTWRYLTQQELSRLTAEIARAKD